MPIRLRALATAVMLLGYNIIGTSGSDFLIGLLSDRWELEFRHLSVGYAMAFSQLAVVIGLACTLYAIRRLPRDFQEQLAGDAPESSRADLHLDSAT
jgi:hypothetical protein